MTSQLPDRYPTGAALDVIAAVFDRIDHAERAGLGHAERLDLVRKAMKIASRAQAMASVVVAEADQAGSSVVAKGTPMTSWLAWPGQITPKQSAALVFAGRDLIAQPAVRDAALAGDIEVAQARSIHKVLSELPDDLTGDQRGQATQLMLAKAADQSAPALAALRTQVLAEIAPDHPENDPECELQRLEAQRKRAVANRHLSFRLDGDGSMLLSGSLPNLEATRFMKVIDSYTEADRRRLRDRIEPATEIRSPGQRRADALMTILDDLENHRRTPTVAGDRPRVVVTIDEADLRQRAEAAGVLDSGQPISAGELRRLCCDADLMPAVLGSQSEVLDIGRIQRLVSPAIRRALSLRDGGCVFPNCDKPDSCCEAHHVDPWWSGGATALDNLALLCPHHHGLVEPTRMWQGPPPDHWQIRIDPQGFPELIPPAVHDPERKPIPGNRRTRLRGAG